MCSINNFCVLREALKVGKAILNLIWPQFILTRNNLYQSSWSLGIDEAETLVTLTKLDKVSINSWKENRVIMPLIQVNWILR